MKRILTTAMALGGLTVGVQAISLDINSNDVLLGSPGELVFDGSTDTFQFVPGLAGSSFVVEGGMDGTGNINGTFTIGPIATAGPLETAPVTTSPGATLVINDLFLGTLSGDVSFAEIFTLGTGGGLNAGGFINLVNVTYNGLNADLQALAADPTASVSIQFGFNPAMSLSDLTADNVRTVTTFTGDLTNEPLGVPEGGLSLILLGTAVGALAAGRRFTK